MKVKILGMVVMMMVLGITRIYAFSGGVDEIGLQALAASGKIELRIYDLANLEKDLAMDYNTGDCYGTSGATDDDPFANFRTNDCISYQMKDADDVAIKSFINAMKSGNIQEAKEVWNSSIENRQKSTHPNPYYTVYPRSSYIASSRGSVVVLGSGLFTFTNGPHAVDMIPTYITVRNNKLYQVIGGLGGYGNNADYLTRNYFFRFLDSKSGTLYSEESTRKGIFGFRSGVKGLAKLVKLYFR